MSEFVFHPDAAKDLEEIWGYIAADNLDAADRVLEEIYETIQSLVPFPYVGHSRPDLTTSPLRFQTVREYVIAYAPEHRPVEVIGILYGRRNPRVIAALLRNQPDTKGRPCFHDRPLAMPASIYSSTHFSTIGFPTSAGECDEMCLCTNSAL